VAGTSEHKNKDTVGKVAVTDPIFHILDRRILANNQPDTLFRVFISSLYMFRASQCSSSGDRIVLIHHLV